MKAFNFALRFLLRSKVYTVINLLGLSLSLACCIVLLRYIHRELTVDSHAKDLSTIVVPLRDIDGVVYPAIVPNNHEDFVIDDRFVVERSFFVEEESSVIKYNNVNYETNLIAIEDNFFNFFDYKVIEGDKRMDRPDGVIVTDKYAERLFGEESPIGKVVNLDKNVLTIVGVIETPICKTTLGFDILVSRKLKDEWGKLNIELLRVNSDFNLAELNKKSNVYHNIDSGKGTCRYRYKYIKWKDFYFERDIADKYISIFNFGNKHYIYVLFGVVFLLFIVGVLNFVNIYFVMMQKRAKVYAIKRVFGISRNRFIFEIWLENFILFSVAIFLSWLFIEVSAVWWEGLLQEKIPSTIFDWILSFGLLIIIPVFTTLLFYIRYKYNSLSSSMKSSYKGGMLNTRNIFLFFQYAITLFLIILSFYFQQHFDFLMSSSHGYKTDGILVTQLYRHNRQTSSKDELMNRFAKMDVIKQKLNECPHIDTWMDSYSAIWGASPQTILNDKDQSFDLYVTYFSPTLLKFFDLKVIDGVIKDNKNNYSEYQYVLNKSAMRLLGYDSLEEASVRSTSALSVTFKDGKLVEHGLKLNPVSAVIDDFYPGPLTEGIKPMLIMIGAEESGGNTLIKVKDGHEEELMKYIATMEKEVYNTEDFTCEWADDIVEKMYESDKKTANIYKVFSYIAIFISCMGLFGVSLYDIRRRYREIAIRKVNGAKVLDLYLLLIRSYVMILIISFIVSVPISLLFIYRYTSEFVVKSPINILIFIEALIIVFVLLLGTLFYQINKASRINPSRIMNYE